MTDAIAGHRLTADTATPEDWPLRPWLLAGLLGIAGLAVHLVSDGAADIPWRMALTAFLFFGSGVAVFTLDRDNLIPSAIFSVVCGLIMAGIAWRAASAGEHFSDQYYWIGAGILAVTLALPLFQSGFHIKRFKTSYSDAHYFVWTDAISGMGALLFTGLSWLVLLLLSSLFELLQIDLLTVLMGTEWFGWLFSGIAFGAALGLLRNQIKVLSTLQSVVLLVLSLLAVPLAIALILFLFALLVSGPTVLWTATRSATPILLSYAIGAFVVVNAVLRDRDADMSGARVQRWAALILALGILPLTVFAAVSMGTRIAQHGLSPERLWALIAIIVATIFGVAYTAAFIRGRKEGWRPMLRQSNLYLATIVSVIALLLAMPILNFAAISTHNQLARLQSGTVSVEEFDYMALRWDFGEPGREALAVLGRSTHPEMAKLAKLAEKTDKYRRNNWQSERQRVAGKPIIQVSDPAVRDAALRYINKNSYWCKDFCRVVELGEFEGRLLLTLIVPGDPKFLLYDSADDAVTQVNIRFGKLQQEYTMQVPQVADDSTVELRPFIGQQLYIDGDPASAPFRQSP